jgi:hypothetical protein
MNIERHFIPHTFHYISVYFVLNSAPLRSCSSLRAHSSNLARCENLKFYLNAFLFRSVMDPTQPPTKFCSILACDPDSEAVAVRNAHPHFLKSSICSTHAQGELMY